MKPTKNQFSPKLNTKYPCRGQFAIVVVTEYYPVFYYTLERKSREQIELILLTCVLNSTSKWVLFYFFIRFIFLESWVAQENTFHTICIAINFSRLHKIPIQDILLTMNNRKR